jgi:hypothetical protein
MPAPGILAAGIAAARAVGGILGKAGKNVNPVYNTPVVPSVKVIKNPGYKGTKQTADEIKKLGKEGSPKNLPKPPSRPSQGSVKVINRSK